MTTVRSHDRTSNQKDPTAAERQRRYRQRRRAGIQVVSVEVDAGIIDMLVTKSRLSERGALDPKKIADALLELAVERTVGPQPPESLLTAQEQSYSRTLEKVRI